MELLPVSFLAGVLTVLAPCVLPVLPVILGRSVGGKTDLKRPLVIIFASIVAIFIFTLLFKSAVGVFAIYDNTLQIISGVILTVFGIFTLFPEAWEKLVHVIGLSSISQKATQAAGEQEQKSEAGWIASSIILGLALGPIFTSCSPTFGLIIATVLPQDFWTGVLNLVVYCLGFALILFAIAALGQRAVASLRWAANPNGWFRKFLGVMFIVLGLLIATGLMKEIETILVSSDIFSGLINFEAGLLLPGNSQ